MNKIMSGLLRMSNCARSDIRTFVSDIRMFASCKSDHIVAYIFHFYNKNGNSHGTIRRTDYYQARLTEHGLCINP